MSNPSFSNPTRRPLPLILIRGFGGLGIEDEKRKAYQGFNDGTVYPHKRGDNYIYEGLILKFLKSDWEYHDATNVVGYYPKPVESDKRAFPPKLNGLNEDYFSGGKLVIDPGMAAHLLEATKKPCQTLWVFRYYDLDDRQFKAYGKSLILLIDFIRDLVAVALKTSEKPKVNIIAHSMGGLIVREAIQCSYPQEKRRADDYINKVVTLGTPHQGISFQILKNWIFIDAKEELERFNTKFQEDSSNPAAYVNFDKHFDKNRLLTIVGTNYRTYSVGVSSRFNRLFSVPGEFGLNYNRSDGLVQQTYAQIPGAPRTFVHRCHGGYDSLVTSREAFEIATRFFFGNIRARLRLKEAKITRGKDMFGKSEFFFGVCIKPRRVDFELFHQSAKAENCYGPFRKENLSDDELTFSWADKNKLIWEGYLNTTPILEDESITDKDLVFRLDFYVGERDLFGIGFSDNVIFRRQYYVRALLTPPFTLYLHKDEQFQNKKDWYPAEDEMRKVDGGWEFDVKDTGFEGTFRIEIDNVPEEGAPTPFGG